MVNSRQTERCFDVSLLYCIGLSVSVLQVATNTIMKIMIIFFATLTTFLVVTGKNNKTTTPSPTSSSCEDEGSESLSPILLKSSNLSSNSSEECCSEEETTTLKSNSSKSFNFTSKSFNLPSNSSEECCSEEESVTIPPFSSKSLKLPSKSSTLPSKSSNLTSNSSEECCSEEESSSSIPAKPSNLTTNSSEECCSEESEDVPPSPSMTPQGRWMSHEEKVEKIRFFMLDRKCEVAKQKVPSGIFAIFKKKEKKTSNCWADINKEGQIPDKLWNPKGAIKFIIHGFQPKFWTNKDKMIENHFIFDMGEEYGKLKDGHNVFGVDWTPFAATGSYPDAAFSTRTAGEETAKFLLNVYKKQKLPPAHWKKVHIIGFSLGSHVAGVTGFKLQKLGNVKAGRITGVGPAGPEFDTKEGLPIDMEHFLEKSDADFVDILHCNMGIVKHWTLTLAKGRYESVYPAGHADFYPNGGETQANECSSLKDKSGCSHMVCMTYFINSIQQKDYLACHCKSWEVFQKGKCHCKKDGKQGTLLGERVDKTATGSYYLTIS